VDISPMSRSDTRRPPSVSMSDFLRMTFRGIVENASSHFHFPFSSAAAKIALHFFFVEFLK
jgi:hypothetical protein